MSFQTNSQEPEDTYNMMGNSSNKSSFIDLNNPNCKDTRDKVRKFLQEKFSK
jgi:hypothetical protein